MLKLAVLSFAILASPGSWAQLQVVSVNNPVLDRLVKREQLIEFERLLGANRWVANRFCRFLKVERRHLDRKFLHGSYQDEAVFIEFETDHMGPRTASAVITPNLPWGSRQLVDPEFGPVEEVRVNLEDKYATWIQFRHTGTHLVQFEIGNMLGLTLCLAR